MSPAATLKKFNPKRWICTAALAAAFALPRNLEDACDALFLPVRKDMEGNKLMKKYMKPRKPTKKNPNKWFGYRQDFLRIGEYCKVDVDAQVELFLFLPPLSPFERRVWELDQKINIRGVRVDRDFLKVVLKLVHHETTRLNAETVILTNGEVESTNKRAKFVKWVNDNGFELLNAQKETIENALKEKNLPPKVRRILEIRQNVSMTSIAKYRAAEMRSRTDGIVRDILLYWGASTGRFTGKGLQLHNLPRGNLKDPYTAVDIVRTGDLELIRMLYGNPMDVFSSCLRSAIISREGKRFYCGDYAAVETRILFWVAYHEAGLQAFREKRDLYCEQASDVYGRKINKKENPVERQIGKKLILGAGFGLGADRFFDSCEEDGIPIDKSLAKRAISAYRTTHRPVPRLWEAYGNAAKAAIRNPGKTYTLNRTTWFVRNRILYVRLPSGRHLSYINPSIRIVPTKWGSNQETIFHWGVHPKTKQWCLQKTWGGVLTENVVQAISRDLLVDAMLNFEEAGYEVTLTVHDENLSESANGNLKDFEKIMLTTPKWAEGLPIEIEAWDHENRYRK